MSVESYSPTQVLTPDDIVREVKHLPSAPRVLPRLKLLLSDVNSAMPDIVALVRLDPGIAARVLQTANSAYYSAGVRCTTVHDAVRRVGFNQIYEVVAYAVASQVLVRPLEIYAIEADELWRMSVCCALSSEVLAEHTGQDRDSAYTVGLLHCVGMVALDEWSLRSARRLSFQTVGFPQEATESERAVLGFTQADAGSALLRHWQFSTAMSEPVRWQYTPRASAAYGAMSGLLHVAKWIRSVVCAPPGDVVLPPPDFVYLAPLGLNQELLDGLVQEVRRRLEKVSSLLDVRGSRSERPRFPAQGWGG